MSGTELHKGALLKHGEYRIERSLGQGGFGITYEAEQVSLRRKVAVKEFFMKEHCNREESTSRVSVPSEGSKDLVEKFRQKFIREARMIAGLDHEHIVKIHDVFEENGTAYYVMEYLGGGSLDRKIKDKGALSENEAVGFIRQIADALSYLHSQNILHFDVKPSNILLGKNGSVKLIDFGISKHYDEAGQQTSSTPVGISKGFAPLEQYKQGSDIKSFTPATDIYALGATLYALLAGSNPPEASDVNDDGIPYIDGVTLTVNRAIEKAMAPRRKDRPQSVGEFLRIIDGSVTIDDNEDTRLAAAKSDDDKPGKGEKGVDGKSGETKKQKVKNKSNGTERSQRSKRIQKWSLGIIGCFVDCFIAILLGLFIFIQTDAWPLAWVVGYIVAISGIWLLKITVFKPSEDSAAWKWTMSIIGVLSIGTVSLCVLVLVDSLLLGCAACFVLAVIGVWLMKITVIRPKKRNSAWNRVFKWLFGVSASIVAAVAIWLFTSPDRNGTVEYVDLGLSVKWASCNIGANSPEDYGNYYSWAETKSKRVFYRGSLVRAIFCGSFSDDFVNDFYRDASSTKLQLDSSYDVAHVKWGGSWRMPTKDEFKELRNKCKWTWTTKNGVNGYEIKSRINNNSIFLPAAGWRHGTSLDNNGFYGRYWSRSFDKKFKGDAEALSFSPEACKIISYYHHNGQSVRPVCP